MVTMVMVMIVLVTHVNIKVDVVERRPHRKRVIR
jgi:hypothetical protein